VKTYSTVAKLEIEYNLRVETCVLLVVHAVSVWIQCIFDERDQENKSRLGFLYTVACSLDKATYNCYLQRV